MTIGIIGLGRMGFAIAERLHAAGLRVIGIDEDATKKAAAEQAGFIFASSYEELALACRVIWLMVPAGDIVDAVLEKLQPALVSGSIIIDGGNSFFKDSIRRYDLLANQGIAFID